MRAYFALAAAIVLLPVGAVPAHADQPPRAPLPLGAGAGASWTDSRGGEHWMHVVGAIGASGNTEILADTYVTTPVTCPDGSTDTRYVSWMGGSGEVGDVVVDKQLRSAVVSARLDMEGYDGGACGEEPPAPPRRTMHVGLTLQATSPAIHSLRITRRRDGPGKPETLVEHTTLRLASGTVVIGSVQHATTEGVIDRYAAGLGDGSSASSLSSVSSLSSLSALSGSRLSSALPAGGPPSRWFREESGWYVSGETARTADSARPGHLLIDESAVNAARTAGEPEVVYAGRHTTRVIRCGGDLATVDTFWDGMGPGRLEVDRSMRAAHATARLRLDVQRYNACTDRSTSWTTGRRHVRFDVVATARPEMSRSLVFDHEGAWTTIRDVGSTRSRDGTGSYVIGAWQRSFDLGGILKWYRSERTHQQRS